MYWDRKEPIKENRIKRRDFIEAGLEEIDERIKIKVRNIKPVKGKGWKYP